MTRLKSGSFVFGNPVSAGFNCRSHKQPPLRDFHTETGASFCIATGLEVPLVAEFTGIPKASERQTKQVTRCEMPGSPLVGSTSHSDGMQASFAIMTSVPAIPGTIVQLWFKLCQSGRRCRLGKLCRSVEDLRASTTMSGPECSCRTSDCRLQRRPRRQSTDGNPALRAG